MAKWHIEILDRFSYSARIHAPSGSPLEVAVRATIETLRDGPRPEDAPYMVPPCVLARARRVQGTELLIVYDIVRNATIRIYAVAVVTDS